MEWMRLAVLIIIRTSPRFENSCSHSMDCMEWNPVCRQQTLYDAY